MDKYEKLYNEALERFKSFKEKYYTKDTNLGGVIFDKNSEMQKDFNGIFPELAESEDERIRKGLIEALKTSKTVGELKFILPEPTREECIAYLEKQKEPQEIPLMNGDADLYFDNWRQEVPIPTFRQCFEEGIRYAQRLQKEQKPVEWSKEDGNG